MPAGPEADLVAEDAEPARPAGADRALGHDAALGTTPVVHRGLLDHELPCGCLDLERGVVEVARPASLQPSYDRLIGAAVEPDEVTTGADGKPVEVHRHPRSVGWSHVRVTTRRRVPARLGRLRRGRDGGR